jgi:hypothetical protein
MEAQAVELIVELPLPNELRLADQGSVVQASPVHSPFGFLARPLSAGVRQVRAGESALGPLVTR